MTHDEPPDAAYQRLSTSGLLDLRLAFVQVQRMAEWQHADPAIDAYCAAQLELIHAVLYARNRQTRAAVQRPTTQRLRLDVPEEGEVD